RYKVAYIQSCTKALKKLLSEKTINDEFQINQFGATYLAASCPRMRGKTEFRFYIIRRRYREKLIQFVIFAEISISTGSLAPMRQNL
ncbi:hypothetical protein HAX54_019275, partial [Datura stramonium]|nr:hypothetical protein [Datura stramonium]